MWNNFLWEKPKAWLSDSYTLANDKKTTSKRVGEAGIQSDYTPHPQFITYNQEGIQNLELLPEN